MKVNQPFWRAPDSAGAEWPPPRVEGKQAPRTRTALGVDSAAGDETIHDF